MEQKIFFISSNNGFFGQTRKPWVSMDSAKIQTILTESGFEVIMLTHHKAANYLQNIKDSIIFYNFSQKENIRYYLLDLVRYLDDGTNLLIPSYDLLKCHENKGYQELFKKKTGIEGLSAVYLSGINDIDEYNLSFPLVFKTLDGSNAKGVKLVKTQKELEDLLKKQTKISLGNKLDILRRRYFRKSKHYKVYPDYSNKKDLQEWIPYITKEKNFILQEYIPNLSFDYRVLALNENYYVMKRHANKGDFRASGTKKFDFDFELPKELLDFAFSIKSKFDTPFLSMDICQSDGAFHLLEFQALHFGINVYMQSKKYFKRSNGVWNEHNFTPDIESDIAKALISFILQKQ